MACESIREEEHVADLLNRLKVEGHGYTGLNFSLIFAIHGLCWQALSHTTGHCLNWFHVDRKPFVTDTKTLKYANIVIQKFHLSSGEITAGHCREASSNLTLKCSAPGDGEQIKNTSECSLSTSMCQTLF